eukprot:TRINITY_DN911_c0_g1_i1.p1 TRINITY_DN911_c0_g1~~TRINITY_DN911_c0_g1_i1.p1  ORF type:complete len:224 (-),score=49.00 TRINITY_DN911_c0_g1_i1:172-843(-)
MDLTATYFKPRRPLCFSHSSSPTFFLQQNSISPSPTITSLCFKKSPARQFYPLKSRQLKSLQCLKSSSSSSSSSDNPSPDSSERWLLEPVGDGDSRHIGFRVPLPSAFEMASNVVTVGRLPDKVDMVIPVATVSGLHARLEKKEGTLLVTDLDSTNGTFIDEKKLRPGTVATVTPGSCITFGDTHLAMFQVSKLKNADASSETDISEKKTETGTPAGSLDTMS